MYSPFAVSSSVRPAPRHPANAHMGVTLLEVVFSIGIIAVGLLGVVIIIPVAGNRSLQGAIADNADRLGRSAIRQFDVQRMRQPNMWALYDANTQKCYDPWTYYDSGGTLNSWAPSADESFCVDPLFLTNNPADASVRFFPYYSAASPPPRMRRLSLRQKPGDIAINPMNGQPFTITDPDNSQWARRVTNGISLDQAARLFMGQDDLVFNLPNDRTLPAQQQYEPAPGADGQWGIAGIDDNGNGTVDDIGEAMWPGSDDFRCQRQWEGKFSWMATITPKLSGSSDLYVRDLYVLSVVVFHRRDLTVTGEKVMPKVIVTMDSTTDYTQNPNILTNLVSAAEVVLQSGNADDLKMKEGEWIMLADAVGSTNFRWFRWYRIQTVDDSPHPPVLSSLTTYAYERNLTLLGPDWPVVDSDVSMRATWIPGVVAVYEKTIRLETSSLWTDL